MGDQAHQSYANVYPDIKCFSHCTSTRIYCFQLPDLCPVCDNDIFNSALKVPPVALSSPLTPVSPSLAHTAHTTLLIKPSVGRTFLEDYQDDNFLHCGLQVDSGEVYDFDEEGLHRSADATGQWSKALSIPITPGDAAQRISSIISGSNHRWLSLGSGYHSEHRNCFTYVLWVLHSAGLYTHLNAEDFIAQVILPRTTQLSRYISLYRRIVQGGGVYVAAPADE